MLIREDLHGDLQGGGMHQINRRIRNLAVKPASELSQVLVLGWLRVTIYLIHSASLLSIICIKGCDSSATCVHVQDNCTN